LRTFSNYSQPNYFLTLLVSPPTLLSLLRVPPDSRFSLPRNGPVATHSTGRATLLLKPLFVLLTRRSWMQPLRSDPARAVSRLPHLFTISPAPRLAVGYPWVFGQCRPKRRRPRGGVRLAKFNPTHPIRRETMTRDPEVRTFCGRLQLDADEPKQ
jgi:hypothetical protein